MKKVVINLISFLLPVLVLVIVPWLLMKNLTVPWVQNPSVLNTVAFIAGLVLSVLGLVLLVITVWAFITIGKGTLAPWTPTGNLIVSGVYAYVRNPMISGVAIVLLGESILFVSLKLLIWFGVFIAINYVYFIFSEEPGLLKKFGTEYQEYMDNVPRWIPRTKPWIPPQKDKPLCK
jgi:Putative protein-S-isoprenylcysteine methyltransferase